MDVITDFIRQFGQRPQGDRAQRTHMSPYFKDGAFRNLSYTPMMTGSKNPLVILKTMLFGNSPRNKPKDVLPSQRVDLHALNQDENVLVWFGHSSYFLQLDGKKFLIDPVFSGHASPFPGVIGAFAGADVYTVDDIPMLDCLIITHDHWDHLDYQTMKHLRDQKKVKQIVTGLGTGAHLVHFGFDEGIITELEWWSTHELTELGAGFYISATPSRHFSGRTLKRNQTLWTSFVLQTPTQKLFLGGDSGYDTHFVDIGKKYGPFDFALLECGQYNPQWKHTHSMPEELILIAHDIGVKKIIPVHWAKFALSTHAWDEPVKRLLAANQSADVQVVTPMIGEKVDVKNPISSTAWWEGIN